MEQRHDDLGVHAGYELHVARVGSDVVDEQRLLVEHCRPQQPLAETHAHGRPVYGIPDRIRGSQLGTLLVEEINRKRLEVDEAADQLRNLLEQVVEVENRRDLAAKVEERRDQVVV